MKGSMLQAISVSKKLMRLLPHQLCGKRVLVIIGVVHVFMEGRHREVKNEFATADGQCTGMYGCLGGGGKRWGAAKLEIIIGSS